MRIFLRAVILVAVLSVELYAVYAVLHPHISADYRAYYIDRTTLDWNPSHYPATPEQGFQFSHAGWPDFVHNAYGFSEREPDGRWTDGKLLQSPFILMSRPFGGTLCVELRLWPVTSEEGHKLQIALGDTVREITLLPGPATYDVSFAGAPPSDRLQFRFDGKVPVAGNPVPGGIDPRRLGIFLSSLRIMPNSCPQGSAAR